MPNLNKYNPFEIGDISKKAFVKRRKGLSDSFLEFDKMGRRGEEFLGISLSKKVINTLFLIIIMVLGVLFTRSFFLQVVQGEKYLSYAEGNRVRIKIMPASRGIIYDREGKSLVENVGSFNLVIIPADLPQDENQRSSVLVMISREFNLPLNQIEKLLEGIPFFSYQPVLLKENISREEAIEVLVRDDLPGVSAEESIIRRYILDGEELRESSFSHVLGYEGKITSEELEKKKSEGYLLADRIGKSGIELSYENLLRGVHGEKKIEVDSRGQELKVLTEVRAEPGKNIKLTIDQELQEKSEEILAYYLKSNGKKKGAVIIQDPGNGEILTLVSLPSFANNDFSVGISREKFQQLKNNDAQPLFNRSIKGEYPSGSTLKPIIALAALEEGIINRNTTFLSMGGIWVYQWFFPDWKSAGHGPTNVIKAIAESVNTFFYIIGGGYDDFEGLGVSKIVDYAKKFGLGDKLGLDLPGESDGFLPTPEWKEKTKNELWYIGDTYHLAIGQGDILVTPLQINSWTATFANGGKVYQPHLLKEVLNEENNIIEEVTPKIISDNFANQQNIEIIRQGLRQAVIYGSAGRLFNLPVSSAGKTGTAQWHTSKQPHAWFTAFAPYEEPLIAITVLVEEGGEGSGTALSVAYDIMAWYFSK